MSSRVDKKWRAAEYGNAGFAGLETRLFAGTHREVKGRAVRYLWETGPTGRADDDDRA